MSEWKMTEEETERIFEAYHNALVESRTKPIRGCRLSNLGEGTTSGISFTLMVFGYLMVPSVFYDRVHYQIVDKETQECVAECYRDIAPL